MGNHRPPPGGLSIRAKLKGILKGVANEVHPFRVHLAYETLHPFMDGNGRSGRALWAWQMLKKYGPDALSLGFLHRFYYQSLEFSR